MQSSGMLSKSFANVVQPFSLNDALRPNPVLPTPFQSPYIPYDRGLQTFILRTIEYVFQALRGPSLCYIHSTLLLYGESRPTQNKKEWLGCVPIKPSLQKKAAGQIWSAGQFVNSCSRTRSYWRVRPSQVFTQKEHLIQTPLSTTSI